MDLIKEQQQKNIYILNNRELILNNRDIFLKNPIQGFLCNGLYIVGCLFAFALGFLVMYLTSYAVNIIYGKICSFVSKVTYGVVKGNFANLSSETKLKLKVDNLDKETTLKFLNDNLYFGQLSMVVCLFVGAAVALGIQSMFVILCSFIGAVIGLAITGKK